MNNYIIFENLNFNPDPRKKLSFSMHSPTMKIAGVEFAPVSGKTLIFFKHLCKKLTCGAFIFLAIWKHGQTSKLAKNIL